VLNIFTVMAHRTHPHTIAVFVLGFRQNVSFLIIYTILLFVLVFFVQKKGQHVSMIRMVRSRTNTGALKENEHPFLHVHFTTVFYIHLGV